MDAPTSGKRGMSLCVLIAAEPCDPPTSHWTDASSRIGSRALKQAQVAEAMPVIDAGPDDHLSPEFFFVNSGWLTPYTTRCSWEHSPFPSGLGPQSSAVTGCSLSTSDSLSTLERSKKPHICPLANQSKVVMQPDKPGWGINALPGPSRLRTHFTLRPKARTSDVVPIPDTVPLVPRPVQFGRAAAA